MSSRGIWAILPLMAAQGWLYAAAPLSLSDAYVLALKNEPRLQAAELKLSAGAESIEQAKANLYPQIQGSVSWGRYEYEYKSSVRPVKENYSDYALSAVQPLFHPEYWRGIDQATSRHTAARYEYQAQQQTLGLEVAKTYFAVLRGHKSVELALSQKEYYENKFRQLQEMLKFGLTNRIDLLETKIALDKATSDALIEQKRIQISTMRLEHMIGEHIEGLQPFDFERLDTNRFEMSRREWENKTANNPVIRAASLHVDTARDEIAMRQYDHYPKIDLNLMRKQTDTADPNAHIYDNQMVVRMSVPLYSGGKVQSRVKEGMILLDAVQKEQKYYDQEVRAQFAEAWEERQHSIELFAVLKESEKSARLYLESIDKAHAAGLKSVVDVLDARAKLYKIKQELVDAGYNLIDNHLTLLEATGELNAESVRELETFVAP